MKKLKLSIEKPCSTTRENFYPVGTGYFCTLCQKEVTDFSHYSKPELAEHFSTNGKSSCGIFRNDQLNKNILPAPTQEFKLSSLILSGLLLTTELCMAQSGITDSLNVDSLITQSLNSIPDDTTDGRKGDISTIDSVQPEVSSHISADLASTEIIWLGTFTPVPETILSGFVQCYPQQNPLPPFAILSDTTNPTDTTGPKINVAETPILPTLPDPKEKSENIPHMDIFAEERKETNIESEDE